MDMKMQNKVKLAMVIAMTIIVFQANVQASSMDFQKQDLRAGVTLLRASGDDQTAPTISFEPNGNTTWAKSQSVVVKAKDDVSADNQITGTYTWQNAETSEVVKTGDLVNGQAISLNGVTGKFNLLITAKDEANNSAMKLSNSFYLDNSVTQVGDVKITKNAKDGEEYKVHASGEETFEGGYTQENLYITKIDGSDDESGHKSTTYEVLKVLTNGTEVSIGSPTIEDMIIENEGIYKIIITTKDQLGNTKTRTVIAKKGQNHNVTISQNGNNKAEASVSTEVSVPEGEKDTTQIYYAWVQEGKEPQEADYRKISSGQEVSLSGVNGEYRLWIKTIDQDGNISITKSEIYHLAGKIEQVSEMIFKLNSETGEDYLPETYTNQNVYVKLKNPTSTENGNQITSTYTIYKEEQNGEQTIVGQETNESTMLTKEGKYKIKVTAKNNLGATGTREYIVYIDKTSPTITFNGNDNYQESGHITINMKDDGIAQAGIFIDTARYYWTRSANTPHASDFLGTEEGGFRGKVTNSSQAISVPSQVSGIWCLWIYVEDKAGNVAIKNNITIESEGNVSYLDNEKPIAGDLILKLNDQEGESYQADTFTNQDVYVELTNGYDADSGVKTNTYSITKNGSSYATGKTDPMVLTQHGIYQVTITTEDNNHNQATRIYRIKIDKKGPQITFVPDGKDDFAKQFEIEVQITEPNDESGVKEESKEFAWISYETGRYATIEDAITRLQEIQETVAEDELADAIQQAGIELIPVQEVNGKIKTPEGKTGYYYLYAYAEDILGNKTVRLSKAFAIDNTKPTRPEVKAVYENTNDVYLGETTNKNVTVIAEHSTSLSGVDQYEYAISSDGGATWDDWKQGTTTKQIQENGETKTVVQGEVTLKEHGNYLVKWRAISELLDGNLISEESGAIQVRIDKKPPEVTFANYQDGKDGMPTFVESILVRATVTDQGTNSVNHNSLKYEWIYFPDIIAYRNFVQTNPGTEELKAKMTQAALAFANGEELPSPKGAQGIYSMFVYAEDLYGNSTVQYSNYYCIGVPEGQNNYEVYEDYILNVDPNTQAYDFILKLKSVLGGTNYTVYDKTGKRMESNDIVTTASQVVVDQNRYTIVVKGDVTGDGQFDLVDLSNLLYHLSEHKLLKDEYYLAADLNFDRRVDLVDLSRMVQWMTEF